MNLTDEEFFKAMFYMLDDYYWHKKSDALGALLGVLNAYLFNTGYPSDSAPYFRWKECKNKIIRYSDDDFLTNDEAYKVMLEFLKLYHTNYGFDFKELLSDLEDFSEYKTVWLKSIEKAAAK